MVSAVMLASRLPRYPLLSDLLCLSPAYALLLLDTVRRWLRHLHHHARRWTECTMPSIPLLSGGSILVLWNTLSNDQLLRAPAGLRWHYVEEADHLRLGVVTQAADPAPAAVLWAPTCSHCGRPVPLRGCILHRGPGDFSSGPGYCCWTVPNDTPMTSAAAACSTVAFGGLRLEGVLPTARLRQHRCPSSPIPAPTPWSRQLVYTPPTVQPELGK
jgi:hypothetical protein